MILGVEFCYPGIVEHPKGDIMRIIRNDAPGFAGFGEAYITKIKQGEIKGWKKHKQMVLNLAVPLGSVELMLKDDRQNLSSYGETMVIKLKASDYYRVTIPPGIWVAFKGIESGESFMVNIADITHKADESINLNFENGWSDIL